MTNRRQFLRTAAALSVTASTVRLGTLSAADPVPAADNAKPWLLKTLKIGMVRIPGSLSDKFAAVKAAGFDGIELDAPSFDIEEARAAIAATGLPVDGTVNSSHWKVRHTDPEPGIRAQALETLLQALRATAAVGGDTMLLVPGHGQDGTPKEVWDRAVANIKPAVELAEQLKVKIAIENVWNHFLYDHQGGTDQTADELARFVDAFDSPWVGVQFDIGNHWKFGDPAQWIRTLDKRIVKLDAKGFSRAADKFTKIGEGDIDWASVRKALKDIGFTGWVAAEVAGGGPERLAEISANLDRYLVKA